MFQGISSTGESIFKSFEVTNAGSTSVNLSKQLEHGQVLQVTLRCKNMMGLVSSDTSQLITMVTRTPLIGNADLTFIHEPQTIYPERENYFSKTDEIWLKWNRLTEDKTIDYCEVRLMS